MIDPSSSRGCDQTGPRTNTIQGDCRPSSSWQRNDNLGPPPGIVSKPDLVAPGVEIPAACLPDPTCDPATQTNTLNTGTSFAAPHVAGAVALLREHHPDWTAGQTITAIKNATIDLGMPGPDPTYGYGRLDIIAADQSTPNTKPPVVTVARQPPRTTRATSVTVKYRVTPPVRLSDVTPTGGLNSQVTRYTANGILTIRYTLALGRTVKLTTRVTDQNDQSSRPASTFRVHRINHRLETPP